MENASKALLIAGAILIVILLIAIGMLVYNGAKSSIDKGISTMTATEKQIHNAQFEPLQQTNATPPPKNIDLILDVPLNISVVLGKTKKSIKDILALGTGSLIELEKLAEEPVDILVNGKQIAYGEVVVVDENFGVRITSIVSNAEKIKSLQ